MCIFRMIRIFFLSKKTKKGERNKFKVEQNLEELQNRIIDRNLFA